MLSAGAGGRQAVRAPGKEGAGREDVAGEAAGLRLSFLTTQGPQEPQEPEAHFSPSTPPLPVSQSPKGAREQPLAWPRPAREGRERVRLELGGRRTGQGASGCRQSLGGAGSGAAAFVLG